MALIFLRVPIIFTILSFEWHESNYRDFIAKDEWPPIHLTLIHWIFRFGGNVAGLNTGYSNRSQNSSWVKMHFS